MNLYIISSPYHLLLALAKADDAKSDFCILIDEENKLANYRIIIEESFKKSWYLDFPKGRLDKYLKFNQLNLWLPSELKKIINFLNAECLNEIFLNNDHFFGAQVLANRINSRSVSYIEDGSIMYNQWIFKHSIFLYTYSKKPFITFLAKNFPFYIDKISFFFRALLYILLFGRNAKQIHLMGTAFDYKDRYVLFPEYVRYEMMNKTTQYLTSKVNKLEFKQFKNLPNLRSFKKIVVKKSSYILFILTRLADEESEKWINNIIKKNNLPPNRVLIKTHPLSIDKLDQFQNKYTLVPDEIPLEIIPTIVDITDIYGPPSTALYSIKFFYPNIEVFCIIKDHQMKSSSLVGMLKKCHVKLLMNY